jgi:hypothetical protein
LARYSWYFLTLTNSRAYYNFTTEKPLLSFAFPRVIIGIWTAFSRQKIGLENFCPSHICPWLGPSFARRGDGIKKGPPNGALVHVLPVR